MRGEGEGEGEVERGSLRTPWLTWARANPNPNPNQVTHPLVDVGERELAAGDGYGELELGARRVELARLHQ